MSADQRLAELGIELPAAPEPAGVYKPFLLVGGMGYVSGHAPVDADGGYVTGKVGKEIDLAGGTRAAQLTGMGILATLRANLGSLDRVRRVVKVLGLVNATPEFTDHPKVINGCSELFAEVFGPDAGVGVRSAVGMGSLPSNIAVEIEAVFEIG